MRAFIVLCMFATASAASYDYGRQADYDRQTEANNGYEGVPNTGYNPDQRIQGGPTASNDHSPPAATGPAEFKKEYFTFSASEDEFDDNANPQLNNDFKRGMSVIFIKGPENSGLENAALKLVKSAVEQRTAIYVLSKQADIGDLSKKLNSFNINNVNKPEVHFVKYRTPADAENAQRAIQNQYDGLGGKSSSHVGVATVLNFASQAPANSNSGGYAPAEPTNEYLPVSQFV